MDLKIDLHIHSTYSDGVLTPEELINKYISEGYNIISITDHDGIRGSEQAIKYGKEKGIWVIPGIELSTIDDQNNEIHILGYDFDFENKELLSVIEIIMKNRIKRNDKLIKKLKTSGYDIEKEYERLKEKRYFIGKPNISDILLKKGFAHSRKETFEILDGANIDREVLSTGEAIRIINNAGGISVLAHPFEIKKTGETNFWSRLEKILRDLKEAGLQGIECIHPSANQKEQEKILELAYKYKLIKTAGSDFHF